MGPWSLIFFWGVYKGYITGPQQSGHVQGPFLQEFRVFGGSGFRV